MSLKVIGAGLGRTGTLSTKYALQILGFDKCYHMLDLMANPERVKYWKELHETGTTDFDAMFEGYQATVDNPGCMYYEAFFKQYPDAKVLLNVRDPESWYESTMDTIFTTKPRTLGQKLSMMFKSLTRPVLRNAVPVFKYNDKAIWQDFFEGKIEDKAYAIDRFNKHNEAVKALVPADQLLVFSVKEGWEPLCKFLGVPVPKVPFPKVNSRGDFHQMIQNFMDTGEQSEEKKVEGLASN